jgi:YVTN family beta-propeller protein
MKIGGPCFRVALLMSAVVFVLGLTCKRDKPPLTPSAPTGVSYLLVNQTDTFSVSTTDPQGDSVRYVWDWGDAVKESTGYYASGATAREVHSWSAAGSYGVTVRAQNARGDTSGWSDAFPVTVGVVPATPPAPTGPTCGSLSVPDTFTVASVAMGRRDSVRYLLDWGDGTQEWTQYYRSGESTQVSHSWTARGTYDVKVMVQDKHGICSAWSPETEILVGLFPNRVVKMIPIGPIDDMLQYLASSPDGEYVYATALRSDFIYVIRTSDNTVVESIPACEYLDGIGVTPNGEYLYAADWYNGAVLKIRTSDNAIVATIPGPGDLWDLAILPNGDYVYATDVGGYGVEVIRTSDDSVVAEIRIGGQPSTITAVPGNEYVYVVDDNYVSVIRTSDDTVVTTVLMCWDNQHLPYALAAMPDGQHVYVSDVNNGDAVLRMRTSDNSVDVEPIPLIQTLGMVPTPDGEFLYVGFGSDSVAVIRTADNKVVSKIPARFTCAAMTCLPSGDFVYGANQDVDSILVIGY